MLGWVGQAAGNVFSSSLLFFFLANFLFCSTVTALPPSSLIDTVALSLEGPLGPTADHDVGNDA
jgi:hypothetical protein